MLKADKSPDTRLVKFCDLLLSCVMGYFYRLLSPPTYEKVFFFYFVYIWSVDGFLAQTLTQHNTNPNPSSAVMSPLKHFVKEVSCSAV